MTKITSSWAGLALTVAIAGLGIFLTNYLQLNQILLALVLGVIVGNLFKLPDIFSDGIKTSSGLVLELAIVLMAFNINYKQFISLGWQTTVVVILTMAGVLIATKLLSKQLKCPGSTGWLIGFGTAICGSSAIAALAPQVTKDKSDIGIAMAVVNLYGLIGMIVLPLYVSTFLTETDNAILLGASLHSVGNVAGAGKAVSEFVGDTAVTIKLGRVALLTPALLLFGHFVSEKNQGVKQQIKLPWYLVTFILISLIATFVKLPIDLVTSTKIGSSFFLSMAMAAIGLRVSFKTLLRAGRKGLLFGAIIFAIQLAIIALLLQIV